MTTGPSSAPRGEGTAVALARPAAHHNNFDFLRFVLATLVLLSHSYPAATGSEATEPLVRLTGGQLTFGSFGVDAFFIISGYLISKSWVLAPVTGSFLLKRVRRIYPGFLAASTLGAFVVAPLFSTAGYAAIGPDFVAAFAAKAMRLLAIEPSVAFPHNPSPGPANGSLWSISYEFWCYVLVLVCGLSGGLRNARLLWLTLTVAIANSLYFSLSGISPGGSYLGLVFGYPPFWARLLPYFLVGMAFHASGAAIALNGRGAAVCALLVIVGATIPNALIVVLPVTAAYLLLWMAQLRLPLISGFARHGDLSYGIYLYSFPILQIVMALRGHTWEPLWLFAVAWPLSILAAAASWHGLEKRFVVRRLPAAVAPPRDGALA